MEPLISVIIPNYNHAKFLTQRIETILNQTYQNFEIIILDDNSTDNSREVIESFRTHAKVSNIVFNTTNSGSAFRQWQKGIELAKGDWIWIAESDDWCEPILLETLVKGITQGCVLSVAQSLVVAFDGEVLWHSRAEYYEKLYEGNEFINNRMLLDNYGIPNASMCIFKRGNYFSIDKAFTNFTFCGDWLFWIMIAAQGKVYVTGKVLNYFRKHDKDVSGSAYQNGLQYLEFLDLLKILVQKNIITAHQQFGLWQQKFKLFLRDTRLNPAAHQKVSNAFKAVLGAAYGKIFYRTKAIDWVKKLGKAV